MQRVASLFLPQLPIERLRRNERPVTPPDNGRAVSPRFVSPVDDDPGSCSVPRGGGWRPGARWARDARLSSSITQSDIDALPAHQRPTQREMGRRSEHAPHPFRAMPPDDGNSAAFAASASGKIGNGRPTVLISHSGQRDILYAVCPIAADLGLHRGMAAAHARALVADLIVREAEPEADQALLHRLALHAARYWTPSASVSGADGLWLDIRGSAHLFGGEERFCRRLLAYVKRLGFTAHIAVAGTTGAAHALARFGEQRLTLIPSGKEAQAIAHLPLAALRLETEALTSAARFGLERISDLYPIARGPLARRLGLKSVERLDQARGSLAEPIIPLIPTDAPCVSRSLLEPINTADSITLVIQDLVDDLVALLQEKGLGARMVALTAERVDGQSQNLTIGASRATRDPHHLRRMFALKISQINPGLGIEKMQLAVPHQEPLGAQTTGTLLPASNEARDLAPLLDQLGTRAGTAALFRLSSWESDVPERAVRRVSPLAKPDGWPAWKRPVRLLKRPEPLTHVVALLPDHPPRRFIWRGQSYQIIAGDGPERIHGEWWRNARELWSVRDYFRVEAQQGERFWIFRRGDGVEAETGDLSWYMHGMFG